MVKFKKKIVKYDGSLTSRMTDSIRFFLLRSKQSFQRYMTNGTNLYKTCFSALDWFINNISKSIKLSSLSKLYTKLEAFKTHLKLSLF